MIEQIKKRDGRLEPFDKSKIESAISRANKEVRSSEQLSDDAIKEIVDNVCFNCELIEQIPEVEDVQEIVEVELMKYEAYSVAKTYIRYRYKHMLDRARQADLMKKIGEKIQATNIENQNANVDEMSFGGRKGEADSALMKQWALDYCISKMARENHENNEVYIHDLDNYAVGMHNCFDSSTRFITKNGVKRFGDCTDGQVVQVVDMYGNWKKATVHNYGKQQMYDLTFRSAQTTKQITCTRNHRWVLSNGEITDHIEVGDAILIAPKIDKEYQLDPHMWCLGFVLGDGCDFYMYSKDRSRITNSGMQVRLCGNKNNYANVFLAAGWSVRQNHDNGDVTVFTRGNGAFKQAFLDNKIWKILSYDDLCNLFEGYICADGHVKDNGSVCISTSDIRLKQMIEDISSTCGYYLWSESEKYNDTNFKEGRILYDLYLVKSQSNRWVLADIQKADRGENGCMVAWCVDEPTTHTFLLDGCMVTGNCLSIPFDDLLANGFNTRQTDVRPAQSVNTAFQLLAVLFQLQSLQQFGGVSATHLDWTMVPYVRKSFYKHFRDGIKYVTNISFEKNEGSFDPAKQSIHDSFYKSFGDPAYEYAMDMTTKEINQAVEGMYHNLNTLQSRSGNQLKMWLLCW